MCAHCAGLLVGTGGQSCVGLETPPPHLSRKTTTLQLPAHSATVITPWQSSEQCKAKRRWLCTQSKPYSTYYQAY